MDDLLVLNALLVANKEEDARLILSELRCGGLKAVAKQVQNEAELRTALVGQTWDVVISEYQLPQLNAATALVVVQQNNQDIPFIVVSDILSEGAAVEILRAGAHDYVAKTHLTCLPEIIRREVQEAQARAYQKQTELELKQTKERLQLAIEGSGVGLWDWFIQTGDLIVNEKWAEMLGYRLSDLAPITIDTWSSHVCPEDLARYQAGLEHHFKGEIDFYECEMRMRHRSGDWIWVLDRGRVVERDLAGNPIRMTGTHLDITQRKRAEAALQISQECLVEAQRIAHIGSWEIDLQDGTLTWSDEVYRIFEIDPQCQLTREVLLAKVHPDHRLQVSQLWDQLTAKSSHQRVYRLFMPDGRIKYVNDIGHALHNEAGEPVRLTGTIQDITAYQEAKLEQERAEAVLQALVQGTAAVTGADFFPELVRHIAQVLDIPHVVASEVTKDGLELLAFWSDGHLQPKALWSYDQVPCCAQVLQRGHCYVNTNAQTYCSERELLIALSIESYLGLALRNTSGRSIGLLCLMSDRPLVKSDWLETLIYTFAARASAELERVQTARKLEALNTELESRVTERTAELQASHHFSERIAETTPHIIYIYDLEFQRNFYVNGEIGKLLGYSPEDIESISATLFAQIGHPEDAAAIARHHKSLSTAGDDQILELEYRLRDCDGNWHWFISRDVVFERDNHHKPTQILGSASDITDRKWAEESLRKKEARYRALMDGASDAILLSNPQGQLVEVNCKAAALLGYTREELTHMDGRQIFPQKDAEIVKVAFQSVLAGHLQQTVEVNVLSKAGEAIPVEITGTLIHIDDATLVQGICRDIRDRKAIESALKRSQERTQATLRALPDIVFRVNSCGEYQDYFIPETMVSLICIKSSLSKSFHETLPPEIAQRHYQALCHVLKTQAVYVYEQQIWLDNMPRYEEVRVAPSGNDEAVFFIRDITDRRQAEKQLRASEAELRALFASISDTVVVHDRTGRCLKIAPGSKNLYLPPEEMLDKTLHETLPTPKADYILGKIRECLDKQATIPAEYCLEIQGQPIYLSANISPLSKDAAVIVARDISDQKVYEAQLQKTNAELARATRLKDEFLANMSHELRTPLNAILGMAEALQENIFGPLNAQQQQSISTIERSGRHLLELINDILDLAKVEAGKMELDITDVSIKSLCKASVSLVKQLAYQKQISLTLQISESLANASIAVDNRRMRQVLINLLSNAIKFTPQKGSVILTVQLETAFPSQDTPETRDIPEAHEQTPSNLAISVIDTGIGIAPENLDKLFQSFVQIDSKLNRQYEGTGLGLALVKRIAEMHGGTVTVVSEVNQGSCFTVILPIRSSNLKIGKNSLSPPSMHWKEAHPFCVLGQRADSELFSQISNQLTKDAIAPWVLLVEDNAANRCSIGGYLQAKGYRLAVANDGYEALEQVKLQPPNIILMDIQMPGVDGLEAIQRIRTLPDCTGIPIIALTALAMPQDAEQCLAAGATAYLAKPVKLKELVITIDKLTKGVD